MKNFMFFPFWRCFPHRNAFRIRIVDRNKNMDQGWVKNLDSVPFTKRNALFRNYVKNCAASVLDFRIGILHMDYALFIVRIVIVFLNVIRSFDTVLGIHNNCVQRASDDQPFKHGAINWFNSLNFHATRDIPTLKRTNGIENKMQDFFLFRQYLYSTS